MVERASIVFMQRQPCESPVASYGTLLLTRINFNPIMDDYLHFNVWDEVTAVEVFFLINSNVYGQDAREW